MAKEEEPIRVVITMTDKTIDVTFSDWLRLNPRKMDRIGDCMRKAWRRQRALVIHKDRVKKAVEAKQAALEEQEESV